MKVYKPVQLYMNYICTYWYMSYMFIYVHIENIYSNICALYMFIYIPTGNIYNSI